MVHRCESARLFMACGLPLVLAFTQTAPVCPAQEAVATTDPWQVGDPVVAAVNQGVAFMEQYDYEEAVEIFEKALELAPKSLEVRINLAIALFNRGAKADVEKSINLLDEVIARQPDNLRAVYFLGIVHQYDGDDAKAVPCFEAVVKARPHDAYAWYLLGRSRMTLEQPARSDLERAIKENPTMASAYYQLAQLAMLEGKQEEAAAYRKTFVELQKHLLSELVAPPQYQRMGPLAVVQSLPMTGVRQVASGELSAGSPKTVWSASAPSGVAGLSSEEKATPEGRILGRLGLGLGVGDVNEDGHLDIVMAGAVRDGRRGVLLLLGDAAGKSDDATQASGLASVAGAMSFAFGDYDNDNHVDLFISCAGPNHLFRGKGDGTFEDVTAQAKAGGGDVVTVSAAFLDADHDADLDIYVCNATAADGSSPTANQLLNNNADGTFTDIADAAGVSCKDNRSIMLAAADIDGDRDTDLVVFNQDSDAGVFFNDRSGKYHAQAVSDQPIRGDAGGVLQDFNGDGRPDLLVSPGPGSAGRLYLSNGTARLDPSSQFDGVIKAVNTWGEASATRVADVDLDGDLDIVVLGRSGHVLLNDGRGRFVLRSGLWPTASLERRIASELVDMTGDGVADILSISTAGNGGVELAPTLLTPPANWLALSPMGDRGDDGRTRSAVTAYGTRLELQCGAYRQVRIYSGLDGGLSQSSRPVVFGLDGASKASYVLLHWPDGVTQSEIGLAANTRHGVKELERRKSSCPVLFAWDGRHFEFVCDFAGVGGLGYYIAPGEYARPQSSDLVKLEPHQLVAREGAYELRIAEPMEEVGYVDRLELRAIDHPRDLKVYPDQRLAVSGPLPTQRPVCVNQSIFAVSAIGPDGDDCTDQLAQVDRVYAYEPKIDPRFFGFARPHTLVLDFGDRLKDLPAGRPVYLLVNGSIEYPYSQTTYAASQARVPWQPMRIDRWSAGGEWETIVPDAGAPGGMGRTFTVDLTGKFSRGDSRLRITTNLEIYYDQMCIGVDAGDDGILVRTIPMKRAELRRLGFPQEYTPDGRRPFIYSYDIIQQTSPFDMPRGCYTTYGRVENLLAEFDDRYVIMGTGDEIAVSFDAGALPPPADDRVRSFVLVSHAWCKDMDLYTAEPDTVGPLPFREMSRYPYPPYERYPDSRAIREYQERYNTRVVN